MKTILVDAVGTITFERDDGMFEVFEELRQLLDSFPNKKVVLTGAQEEQFSDYALDQVSYPVFTLSHSPEKTDPAYYQKVLEHFDLKPDDVVYFEHAEAATLSARSAGINTYHYDSEARDLDALKKWLKKNL